MRSARGRSLINRFLLAPQERLWAGSPARAGRAASPVFIIGPPRSGSTLLMQVLTDAFDVGYLSNGHCRWFGAPGIAERAFRPLHGKQVSDYASNHGRTEPEYGPAECGAWWYRFFVRDPAYTRLSDVSPANMKAFSRSIRALGNATRKPLLFKNLYAALRLEPIARYVPNALFVVIERDLIDNAQSILRGRMDTFGGYAGWWSVPPPDIERLVQYSPAQQVLGQIRSIHTLIDRDVQRLGLEQRTFRISYEGFCRDVHGTLDAFHRFMAQHGVDLAARFAVPAQFEIRRSREIPDAMYQELTREAAAMGIPPDATECTE